MEPIRSTKTFIFKKPHKPKLNLEAIGRCFRLASMTGVAGSFRSSRGMEAMDVFALLGGLSGPGLLLARPCRPRSRSWARGAPSPRRRPPGRRRPGRVCFTARAVRHRSTSIPIAEVLVAFLRPRDESGELGTLKAPCCPIGGTRASISICSLPPRCTARKSLAQGAAWGVTKVRDSRSSTQPRPQRRQGPP